VAPQQWHNSRILQASMVQWLPFAHHEPNCRWTIAVHHEPNWKLSSERLGGEASETLSQRLSQWEFGALIFWHLPDFITSFMFSNLTGMDIEPPPVKHLIEASNCVQLRPLQPFTQSCCSWTTTDLAENEVLPLGFLSLYRSTRSYHWVLPLAFNNFAGNMWKLKIWLKWAKD
jgi:hypothetical protein